MARRAWSSWTGNMSRCAFRRQQASTVSAPWLNVSSEQAGMQLNGCFCYFWGQCFCAAQQLLETEVLPLSLSISELFHPFSLSAYPDCHATRTVPRQPAVAAARYSVLACLQALLRHQLHLREAFQPARLRKREKSKRRKGRMAGK